MKLFLTLALIVYSTAGVSQVSLKLVTGLTSSAIKGNKDTSSRRYAGHFGLLGTRKISEHAALKAGLIYSSRGGKLEYSYSYIPAGVTNELTLSYLEIPLLYAVEPSIFSIFIGPQYSALLSAKINTSDGSGDVKSAFKNGSFDIRYGFGIRLGKFGGQLHFVNGLSNILRYDDQNSKWRSKAFCISASYAFIKSESRSFSKNQGIPHRPIE